MTSTSDEVGHTATPWFVDGDGVNRLIRGADQTIVAKRHRLPREIHSANFSLIVNAVNSHDSLVKALDEIADPENLREPKRSDHATDDSYWMTCGIWMMALKARAALSQVKGGK